MNETTATLVQGISNKIPRAYAAGVEEGKAVGRKAEYDAFWDAFFTSTEWIGKFAGSGWNNDTFYPNRDININGTANYCFFYNGCKDDLVERFKSLGRKISIKPPYANSMFYGAKFTRLPEIDLSNVSSLSSTFYNCPNLVTIDKVIIKDNGSSTFPSTFNSCTALENIIIEGVIGKDIDFKDCKKLTKVSLTSIMNARSTTASFTITFSKEAVDNAFETSAEWQALVNARPNVTVSLI